MVLGLFRGHFVMILGSCWYCFGIVFGTVWDPNKHIVQLGVCVGTRLGPHNGVMWGRGPHNWEARGGCVGTRSPQGGRVGTRSPRETGARGEGAPAEVAGKKTSNQLRLSFC